MEYHTSVLLEEALDFLRVRAGGRYIDCTLGDGGHAVEMLRLGARVLGMDINEVALARATQRVEDLGLSSLFVGVCGSFADVEAIANRFGFGRADGILYDLGTSSFQLLDGGLGLSFKKDEPLDMRLDKNLSVTAADLVNALSEAQLKKLFTDFGEERYAGKFAKAICARRSLKKFNSAKDLAELVAEEASPGYEKGRIHPATRVFLALRIAVNDELANLFISLPRAARLLAPPERELSLPGGRMVIITFHSLEDRLVKEFGRGSRLQKIAAGVLPQRDEVTRNVRARSAKMHVFERMNEQTNHSL